VFTRGNRGEFPRVNTTGPYQVVVQVCEKCENAEVATSRGSKPIAPATLKTVLCDAKAFRKGEKNRSTVPPSMKLEALVRDRYRCQGMGCGSARFLNVHHIVPREVGGPNTLENLITLCSGCHRTLHDLAEKHLTPRGLAET
jgi:5-methylcytosine-specific restriction endonuclease McrA